MSSCTESMAKAVPLRTERKGMSPTTNLSGAPRRTALTCSAIISTVACTVLSKPCMTMARLSPTSRVSISVSLSTRADQQS